MKDNEEYLFFLEGRPIMIRIGKSVDVDGQIVYWAESNFRRAYYTLAENLEAALEKCVKKIKLAMKQQNKEVKLMKDDQAAALAEKYFFENYTNRTVIKEHLDEFWPGYMAEGETLTFTVKKCGDKDHAYDQDRLPEDPPTTVAIVYVNLLTGECDMIENKAELGWHKDD